MMSQSEQINENNNDVDGTKVYEQSSVDHNTLVNSKIEKEDEYDSINNDSYVLGYN